MTDSHSLLPPRSSDQGHKHIWFRKAAEWAFLVVKWLGIHLPMQGTQVRALVREDPTCRGVTKPVCYNS